MNAKKIKLENINDTYDVMDKTGTNFIPVEQELITIDGISIPDHKAIYRNDNKHVLGIVGMGYKVITPAEMFALSDTLIKEHGAKYKSVTQVDGGKKIRIEAEPEGMIRTGNGDLDYLKKRIFLTNSFDGSTKFIASYGLYRPLCSNMQIWEAKETRAVAIRHTANIQYRMAEALRIMNTANDVFEVWEQKVQYLSQKIVTKEQVEIFLNRIVGVNNIQDDDVSTRKINQWEKMESLYVHGQGNHGNTAWDLYNATTEYYDHYNNTDNEEKRLASAMFGTGSSQKTKAFNLALEI